MNADRAAARVAPEPDFRFTLANERTFLAWIRTSMAMSAAAAGVSLAAQYGHALVMHGLSIVLGCSAFGIAIEAPRRWRAIDTAIRLQRRLPTLRWLGPAVALGAIVLALLVSATASAHLVR